MRMQHSYMYHWKVLEPQLEQHHLSVQLPPQEVWAVDLDTHTLVPLILRCCNLRPILHGQTWNNVWFHSNWCMPGKATNTFNWCSIVFQLSQWHNCLLNHQTCTASYLCMIVVRVYTDVENCSNFMSNGLIPMQNFKTGSCRIRKKGIAIITRKKFCKTHQLERSTLPDLPYQENSKKWDQNLSHTLLLHTLLHCYCP